MDIFLVLPARCRTVKTTSTTPTLVRCGCSCALWMHSAVEMHVHKHRNYASWLRNGWAGVFVGHPEIWTSDRIRCTEMASDRCAAYAYERSLHSCCWTKQCTDRTGTAFRPYDVAYASSDRRTSWIGLSTTSTYTNMAFLRCGFADVLSCWLSLTNEGRNIRSKPFEPRRSCGSVPCGRVFGIWRVRENRKYRTISVYCPFCWLQGC